MRRWVQVWVLLVLVLNATMAAEESCSARCGTFNPRARCQCDPMCVYHRSCCDDFQTACQRKARGDTFASAEDFNSTVGGEDGPTTTSTPTSSPTHTATPTRPEPVATTARSTGEPTATADPAQAPCSGRPFDAFLQLKNGSIYAFRGEYFFELDESSVLPGYPKLIEDVWGIPGPIDAAFTRINCQGKTYLFKGNQYWRFEGDVLDKDYPRGIAEGFENMPNNVNAAFAIPAPSLHGREKAYFFKGDQYHQYEFKHQPSHEECVTMTRSSPSLMFTQYTSLYHDQLLDELFAELFRGPFQGQSDRPRVISRDWVGIKPPIDAAMVGRLYLTPRVTATPPTPRPPGYRFSVKRRGSRRRQKGRKSRSPAYFLEDIFNYDYNEDYGFNDFHHRPAMSTPPPTRSLDTPVQNVYFFKSDKYYRANLKTKRVDRVTPPYPRSIAKYWLGCDVEVSRAEKR